MARTKAISLLSGTDTPADLAEVYGLVIRDMAVPYLGKRPA